MNFQMRLGLGFLILVSLPMAAFATPIGVWIPDGPMICSDGRPITAPENIAPIDTDNTLSFDGTEYRIDGPLATLSHQENISNQFSLSVTKFKESPDDPSEIEDFIADPYSGQSLIFTNQGGGVDLYTGQFDLVPLPVNQVWRLKRRVRVGDQLRRGEFATTQHLTLVQTTPDSMIIFDKVREYTL